MLSLFRLLAGLFCLHVCLPVLHGQTLYISGRDRIFALSLKAVELSPYSPTVPIGAWQAVFGESGDLFVACNGSIHFIDREGAADTFASKAAGINGAYGLAMDQKGILYTTNTGIYADGMDASGSFVQKITPDGQAAIYAENFTTSKNALRGMVFDSVGNLYVASYPDNKIYKIDSQGGVTVFASLAGPYGLAFDAKGDLFVSQANLGKIQRISPEGEISPILLNGVLETPEGIAFGKDGVTLYVAEYGGNRVSSVNVITGEISKIIDLDFAPTFLLFGTRDSPIPSPKPNMIKVESSMPFQITMLNILSIPQGNEKYRAWGTLAEGKDGELAAGFSGSRHEHVCPFGRAMLIWSRDAGQTWSEPEKVKDGLLDQRDTGLIQTSTGAWIATWFTSLAWRDNLRAAQHIPAGGKGEWPAEKIALWDEVAQKVTDRVVEQEWGVWSSRSEDGGKTWSAPVDSKVNSPHGPALLKNGHLLYVGKDLWRGGRCLVSLSRDDGKTWEVIGRIPGRKGDNLSAYHEFHAVEAADGRIIAHLRNHNENNEGETLQCESFDQGKTWSVPHSIGVPGYPSHLLRLADGDLVMTYSHRQAPISIQARLSRDNGQTWSQAAMLSDRFTGWDMGYPSTVQRPDGTLRTLWYSNPGDGSPVALFLASWKIND